MHWVVQHEHALSLDDVVTHVHAWNVRKQQFTSRQIGIALDVLASKGWIDSVFKL